MDDAPLIIDLDDATLAALERRATLQGRSLEDEVIEILSNAVRDKE